MSFESIWQFLSGWLYPAVLVVFFFGLTICIHEFGHFLVARKRGMKVERFSLGFGPAIVKWVRDGVEYRISWIPFGGYVSLPQMAPMETIEGKSEAKQEPLPPASPSSKALVALAGPVMNILLAFVLALIIWQFGLAVPVNPSVVGWVRPGSVEEQKGIQPGDRIVEVDGRPVQTWMDVNRAVALSLNQDIKVVLERNGQQTAYQLPAEFHKQFGIKTIDLYPAGRPFAARIEPDTPAAAAGIQPGDRFMAVEGVPVASSHELVALISQRAGEPTSIRLMRDGQIVTVTATPAPTGPKGTGRLGVPLGEDMEYLVQKPGPPVGKQFGEVFQMLGDTWYALTHAKETGVGPRSFSGPVGIAGGWWLEISSGGITRGIKFAILINIALAVFNLLPLPVLDGGHIVFAGIEGLLKRPLNARIVNTIQTAFAVVLIGFMLFVTAFDFQKFFGHHFTKQRQTQTTPPETNAAAATP